ncbi:MAG: SUMF1/EgtB/PvdO family nonheme iron enzyme [Bacteroidales bacterium]|nr:SUMF1/EgtB/PvdO family nonheme iron enzyme [Bacteroidales bacterium]
MDKRYFTLFFLLLFVGFAAVSQDLKITRIEASRLSKALIDRVTDLISGEECAVLHIKTEGLTPEERDQLDFQLDQASTIARTLKDGGEILMYVPPRTVLLVVKSPFGNYRADFRRDFGFPSGTVKLKDYDVYIEYNRPAPVPDPEADMGGQYFVLTVTPATANVYVDGDLRATTDGELNIMLPYGEHKYRIEAPSFVGDEGTFTIGKTKVTKTVTLVSAQAHLTLSCGDSSAELYLNDKKIGTGSWNGSLDAGMYIVEARRAGHSTVRQSLTLAKQERRSLTLNAPKPIYGKLNLNSTPGNCDVYLDGKKIGTSPDIFSNVLIGTHSIELRKEGYENATKQVVIEENKIAQATVALTKKQQTVAAGASGGSAAGNKTFTVNGVTFEMVAVKGGTFTMGGTSEQGSDAYDDEKPTHSVTLGDYYIGKFEVTQELWEAIMGSNPSYFKGSKLPVEQVSWDDCQTFIRKLNSLTGANFRLPTEAEWEYAARGGSRSRGYKYSGSNSINDVAWYTDNSGSKTHVVGTKSPNELGIYDMSGNVWEWCQDWYGSYSSGSQTNPQGPSSGSSRVLRGGSWLSRARLCRVSNRFNNTPAGGLNIFGFRLVLVP